MISEMWSINIVQYRSRNINDNSYNAYVKEKEQAEDEYMDARMRD